MEHTWTEANCSTARTCSTCGTTDGAPLGHSWLAATCEAPKTCENCGETQGEAKSHSWQDATCIMPKTCSVCHATEGKANGHDWQEATSDAPKTCRTCGETDGNKLNVDPRFKTSACQFLFGEWKELVTEVTEVNGKEYTITYWVYYDFQNDGTVTIQMIIDDVDAFRATFEAMMIDMMYTAFAEMGLSKIQADNEFMKQYNMTIPQYCKLYADEYIRSMTETVQKLVYYVEKDVLYVAETWKSEFFGESFKVVDDEVHIDYADGSGTYVLMPMP